MIWPGPARESGPSNLTFLSGSPYEVWVKGSSLGSLAKNAALILVFLLVTSCASEQRASAPPSSVAAQAPQAGQAAPDCPPGEPRDGLSGAEQPRNGGPAPRRMPPNSSRVVADVLKASIYAPGSLRNARPPIDSDQVFYSLLVSVVSSVEDQPGQRNMAAPGLTIEVFLCSASGSDLTAKRIEATLTLTGGTSGTRWWLTNLRALP